MSACPTLLPGTVNDATSRPECGILIRPTRIEESGKRCECLARPDLIL